jgi:RND superfamily putative drug exporter
MFNRITSFVTRHPKRVIALWAVLTIGLAMVAATQGYKVTTDDTAQFLPKGSESAQATRYGQDAFGQQKGTRTVTALVKRPDGKTLRRRPRGRPRAERRLRRLATGHLEARAQGPDPR